MSADSDLLHVNQQRLSVVLPLDGKLAGVREFITGQLHRHLETVGVQVAEIIHACETEMLIFKIWLYDYPVSFEICTFMKFKNIKKTTYKPSRNLLVCL